MGRGWIVASELDADAVLETANGMRARVGSATLLASKATVYNLGVEGLHNYFVGEVGAWVHNTCNCAPTPTDRLKEHVLNGELDAARREARGEIVGRWPDGTPYNHIHELRDAQNGLLRRIRSIKRQLSSNDLDDVGRQALQDELSEASRLLDRTEEFLPR